MWVSQAVFFIWVVFLGVSKCSRRNFLVTMLRYDTFSLFPKKKGISIYFYLGIILGLQFQFCVLFLPDFLRRPRIHRPRLGNETFHGRGLSLGW